MLVEEIKSKLPHSDVHSLSADATHIIVYDKRQAPLSVVRQVMEYLHNNGVKAVFVSSYGENPLTIYEVK